MQPAATSPLDLPRKDATLYPYRAIWINGRPVMIEKIILDQEPGRSPFEDHTFGFIRAWLSGEQVYEMRTSGSTGAPKIIEVSREQMQKSARKTAAKIGLEPGTASLVCIDTHYIGGKMMLARALTLGLPIIAVDPCANPLIRIPIDKCVQFAAMVPYQIQAILESKHPHLLNNLNKVLIGGAPLAARDVERLQSFQCACFETYGMTETVSHIALRLVNTDRKQSFFEVLAGVQVSQDARGCLVVAADHLDGPVVTNDLVELVGEGKFLWRGRFDSVINSGGVKVSPEKIESELARIFHEHRFPHRFIIAALPDDKLGNKVVLVLEGVQFSSDILNQSLTALKSVVSPYEFPREVYRVDAFAMTPTHKVDRQQTLAGIHPLS